MSGNIEFGAYIPESFLDSMSHAEAYITARILYWLNKKDKVHKTNQELIDECRVSSRHLKEWKKKVKENNLGGLTFEVHGFPKKKTFYSRLVRCNLNQSFNTDCTDVFLKTDLSYIEHKILHKPPISPNGTFQFEFTEDSLRQLLLLTFGESTYASWFQSTPISWDKSERILFLHPTSSFRKSRLESIVLMQQSGSNVLQKYNIKIEIKI